MKTPYLGVHQTGSSSRLPKTLTNHIWNKNREEAFSLLDKVGSFLTDQLGMALDKTNRYIPYDSIFAPMAVAWKTASIDSLAPKAKADAYKKLCKWVVGSALSQRYQEGVHNKQKSDAVKFAEWILGQANEPEWLQEVSIPPLRRVSINGAIGKMLLCMINLKTIRDPLTKENVSLGTSGTNEHHIFPKKYCDRMTGWNSRNDDCNIILNVMRLTEATNIRFLNDDPMVQVNECIQVNTESWCKSQFEDQFIPENCFEILRKKDKTRQDFVDFIALREASFSQILQSQFGFLERLTEEDADD